MKINIGLSLPPIEQKSYNWSVSGEKYHEKYSLISLKKWCNMKKSTQV